MRRQEGALNEGLMDLALYKRSTFHEVCCVHTGYKGMRVAMRPDQVLGTKTAAEVERQKERYLR